MNIKFIGTGSGKTSLRRFHSSLLLGHDDYNLLIDCGDGISRALLKSEIPFDGIGGILISHLHPDHYSGLASLLLQMKLIGRKEELNLFVHESIIEFIKKIILQSYIFVDRIGFEINFVAFNDEENLKLKDGFTFASKQNSHLNKYKSYDEGKNLKFSCSSFLFWCNGKTVFYTGDIGDEKDLYMFRGNFFNVIISEISHVGLEDILKSYKELKPEKFVITHIDEEDETALDKFLLNLNEPDREKIYKAYDG